MRRRRGRRGVEADECLWIANAARMAGRRAFNARTDPPPDLALEVDVIRSSLNRLRIYASLGVPEVWRLDGNVLTFYVLDPAGAYASATISRSFPAIGPGDLVPFLQQARQSGDHGAVVEQFRAWLRQRLAGGAAPTTP